MGYSGRQALQEASDAYRLFPVVGLDVGVAAGEEFVQRGAEGAEVAAAGPEEVEVLLYGPGPCG
ncbi:hypothetical protein OG818_40500 [Streptomyces virginiae]|uniref:hypothetical protein n=1 Tax=Streptomyces virginiae TaxID=1961 RepID=UPI0022569C3B|nr:hypothetical protein [Streptomyces virginiae]MCX4721974.1 hypothetical protein [Streptomyces virginiae]